MQRERRDNRVGGALLLRARALPPRRAEAGGPAPRQLPQVERRAVRDRVVAPRARLRARVGAGGVALGNAYRTERRVRAARLEGRLGRSARIRPRRRRGGLKENTDGRGGGAGTRRGGMRHVETRSGWTSREVARTFKKEYDIDSASGLTRSGERGRASEARCGEGRTASIVRSTSVARRDRWCDVAMACGARLRVGARGHPFKRGANENSENSREWNPRPDRVTRVRGPVFGRRLADESSILRARGVWRAGPTAGFSA